MDRAYTGYILDNLQACEALSGLRDTLGLTEFFELTKARGLSVRTSHYLFLCGFAPDESLVSMTEYRKRGENLEKMRKEWMSMWT